MIFYLNFADLQYLWTFSSRTLDKQLAVNKRRILWIPQFQNILHYVNVGQINFWELTDWRGELAIYTFSWQLPFVLSCFIGKSRQILVTWTKSSPHLAANQSDIQRFSIHLMSSQDKLNGNWSEQKNLWHFL